MTFLSNLFGGAKPETPPAPPPPAPRISDSVGESAARAARQRLNQKYGSEDTILTGKSGLGDMGAAPNAAPAAAPAPAAMDGKGGKRRSLLG